MVAMSAIIMISGFENDFPIDTPIDRLDNVQYVPLLSGSQTHLGYPKVTNEVITTQRGPKKVTRVDTYSKNRGLGGMAIPDFDTYFVNHNSVFPADYSAHHERGHLREYEETGVPMLDELINRDLSDRQYRKITGKHIDTVTPYEEQIENILIEKRGKEEAKAAMNEVRKIKKEYVDRNMGAVDLDRIAKEFRLESSVPKNETPEEAKAKTSQYII
jgi:hypothetical protein